MEAGLQKYSINLQLTQDKNSFVNRRAVSLMQIFLFTLDEWAAICMDP
jgi:hypothetical protein